jgi:hypothetical protein
MPQNQVLPTDSATIHPTSMGPHDLGHSAPAVMWSAPGQYPPRRSSSLLPSTTAKPRKRPRSGTKPGRWPGANFRRKRSRASHRRSFGPLTKPATNDQRIGLKKRAPNRPQAEDPIWASQGVISSCRRGVDSGSRLTTTPCRRRLDVSVVVAPPLVGRCLRPSFG